MTLSLPDRKGEIDRHRQSGGRIAAVFPIHYPRALLQAFGYLAVEVWDPIIADTSAATVHLPSYCCSVVRNGLALLLKHGLSDVDLIMVPHCCDTLQGLGSLLHDFVVPKQALLTPYLPRGERAYALSFLHKELQAMFRRLVELTGVEPTTEDLQQAIEQDERRVEVLQHMHRVRPYWPLSNVESFSLTRMNEYMTAERFCENAAAWLEPTRSGTQAGVPVVLSGIVPEWALLQAMDTVGMRVVADDLACSSRRLYAAGTSTDPLLRMAQSLLSGPPDPMLGSPLQTRVQYLQNLTRTYAAKGVVFAAMKFCEPEHFDLPLLSSGLRELAIPSFVVDVEVGSSFSGQALTRLEAFVEMLS